MLLKGTHHNTCNTFEFREKRCIPMRVYFGNPNVYVFTFLLLVKCIWRMLNLRMTPAYIKSYILYTKNTLLKMSPHVFL